ncbi:MAG: hypothetical protein ABI806_19300 [Candidatus Solibacter sp.]
MPINLKTVIAELQFVDQLITDDKTDTRLPDLLDQVKVDLATAIQNVPAEDPLIG